ncbi:N-acetyl-D-glucosamine kinase [Aethina tumida]|uniref:N-acetyl-D-glucosamine kinase n=1 Tax=Aethina tumida TaxID=116153 RepID=UPI00096AEB49|nr:N-acetyl-D-glucosamine kinase [Aethina tumida]
MQSIIVGGIEGGATHSNAVLLNESGAIIAKSVGPGTNHHLIGMEECRRRIDDMINEAKTKAGLSLDTPIDALGLSLSGCEQEESNNIIVEGLRCRYPNLSKKYVIASDTDGSVAAVSNKGGVVCIAGTGSNTLLINPDGTKVQCGGWGYLLGDEGSAWKIVQRAIKYCFDDLDNFAKSPHPIDRTWREIQEYFKIKTQADLLGTFYGSFDKAFISKLCKQLSEVANEGDSLARHIFEEAGTDLAKSISSVICKASPELTEKEDGIQINCVGSVWLSWRLLKKGFIEYLNTNSDVQKLSLIKLTTSSSVGAALMASDKLDIPVARDYSKNYEVFFKYTKGMSLNCS